MSRMIDKKPEIVCLCGSTRFYDEYQRQSFRLTLEGKIVLSVGFFERAYARSRAETSSPPCAPSPEGEFIQFLDAEEMGQRAHGPNAGITEEQKRLVDELHLRKIDLAQRVFFINIGGYIGHSTHRELAYSILWDKTIEFYDREAGLRYIEQQQKSLDELGVLFMR